MEVYNVFSVSQLNSFIEEINQNGAVGDQYQIRLFGDESNRLSVGSGSITPINTQAEVGILSGTGIPLIVWGGYRGFVILNGIVTLTNLIMQNLNLQSPFGSLGAGAALFVANTPEVTGGGLSRPAYQPGTVTLVNVSFIDSSVQGGESLSGGTANNSPAPVTGIDLFGNVIGGGASTQGCFGLIGSGGEAGVDPIGGQGGYGSAGGAGAGVGGGMGGPSGFAGYAGGAGGSPIGLNGADSGTGGGLGGGIFAMDGADVFIRVTQQTEGIQGNTCTGAYTAGEGIFLHGNGMLRLDIASGVVYTIADEITDERNAFLRRGISPTGGAAPIGPDGISCGGGNGVWGLSKKGGGTLILPKIYVAGMVQILDGLCDLTGLTVIPGGPFSLFTLFIADGGGIVYKPDLSPATLEIGGFYVEGSVSLYINGYSRINLVESVNFSGAVNLHISPDSTGFTSSVPVDIITFPEAVPSSWQVTVDPGYTVDIDDDTISVTLLP